MAVEVKLPQLGESTYEGTIGRWLKQPGDRVERFEPLVEIITDKVNVEMPSPFAGVLKEILVPEGETKNVGTPIAVMEVEAGAVEAAGVEVAPAAERHSAVATPTRLEAPAPAVAPGDQLIKLTPLRRTIAQRMAQSKREIPHAYGVIEVDVTELVGWREAHKEEWRRRHGSNLTYTAFFVRAAARALRAFPIVNSTWSEEGILQRGGVHVGVGVAIEDGLTVPVIRDADQKNLVTLARDLEDLGRRAREGTLTLEDVQRGTFTITNPGVFGSIWSMPIILPGQAAILATDAIVKRPVVRNDAIVIGSIMHLGLSFDHRIFDGAVADQFLIHIKTRLEGFRAADASVTDI